jgi:uncharacterized membrane protein
MAEKTNEKTEIDEVEGDGIEVSSRFMLLLVLGFVVVTVGIILIAISSIGGGSVSVGGIIFIGPFPIVFGAGPDAAWLIAISIMLAVVSVVLFVLFRRRN